MTTPAGDRDSAASKRQKELAKKLGIDTYARFPRELLEARMDRPPKEEAKRAEWKPFYDPKTRIYNTYLRYSWCWPICLEYAVVTDDRDEILRDHKGRPLVLSQEAVARMLGLSQQRVQAVVLDLIAEKVLRAERAPDRQHTVAVYPEAKPTITEEDRRDKSTQVSTGLDGPRLEPAILRRFINLLNQLGRDDATISVPVGHPDGSTNGERRSVRIADYRTQVWRDVLDNRTSFLASLKQLRYNEYSRYRDLATQVRNLIDQIQSPDLVRQASSSSAAAPLAAAVPTTMKTPSHDDEGHVKDGSLEMELADRVGLETDAAKTLLTAVHSVDSSLTVAEIADLCEEKLRQVRGRMRSGSIENIVGFLITAVPNMVPDYVRRKGAMS